MSKTIRILAIIAVVQLVLVAITWVGGSDLNSKPAKSALLEFDKTGIDQILIKGDDQTVTLKKVEGRWRTDDAFPADQNKVSRLLNKLEKLQAGLPVAVSADARKRFKVDQNNYERYLALKKGDQSIAELYLGTGAGANQTHARAGDEKQVYSVALGIYSVPVKTEDWQDKNLLQLADNTVTSIALADLTLQHDNSASETDGNKAWRANNLPENKQLDQKAVNDSLSRLLNLRFDKVLGKTAKPEYGLEKPVLDVTVTHKGGKRRYQLGKLKDSQDYVLKVSDRDEYFKIASYVGEPLINGISKDKWVTDKPVGSQEEQPQVDSETETNKSSQPAVENTR